jgi:hypothetical protein
LALTGIVCPLCGGKVREIERWYPKLTAEDLTRVGYKYSCETCGYSAVWSSLAFQFEAQPARKFRRFVVQARLNGGRANGQLLAWWPDDQFRILSVDGTELNIHPVVKGRRVRWRRRTKVVVDYPSLAAAIAATRPEHLAIAATLTDPPEFRHISNGAKKVRGKRKRLELLTSPSLCP